MHTALKMHRRGWRTAFLGIRQAGGLARVLSGHIRQRVRWARGMVQILRVDNPLFGPGLTWPQRLCCLTGCSIFCPGFRVLSFLRRRWLFASQCLFSAAPVMVLSYALPPDVHTPGDFKNSRQFSAIVLGRALRNGSLGLYCSTDNSGTYQSTVGFQCTAKGRIIASSYFDWRIALPFLVLFGLNLIGIVTGLIAACTGWQLDAVLINVGWASYNLVILSVAIAAAFERQQRREHARVSCGCQPWWSVPWDILFPELSDLSLSGAALGHAGEEIECGEALHLTLRLGEESLPLPRG